MRMRIQGRSVRGSRIVYGTFFTIVLLVLTLSVLLIKSKEYAFETVSRSGTQSEQATTDAGAQFPVGVDPETETIVEQAAVKSYFANHLSRRNDHPKRTGFWGRLVQKLLPFTWYQNLASPTGRILVIRPGERKEEVAEHFGDILGWDDTQRKSFISRVENTPPSLTEGKFFPGSYMVRTDASPRTVANILIDHFDSEVLSRYSPSVDAVVPLKDTLVIASLLEREAYDFTDMRTIAGIIWNRLFVDMKLQLDATLQYAKGTHSLATWWPQVRPNDKYIDSPFNTYQHAGLPPAPIGSPSLAAVLAALNPTKTDCMYYFHDARGVFHCSGTYREHVSALKQMYGAGR